MSDTPIYDRMNNPDDRPDDVSEGTYLDTDSMHEAEPEQNNTTPNKWIPSRAVRTWLYGVAVAAAAVLVGYGVLTVEQGGLWLSLFGALLGVGNAVAARNVPRG